MWARPNKPELDATKVPTAIDIAWSAGVYEGEGSARLCGKTKRGFMISLPQKDPEILYRLRDFFGGSIRIPNRDDRCCVWECCGDRARIFVSLIYPFLSTRRKVQIDVTRARDFLRGTTEAVSTVDEARFLLLRYYETEEKFPYSGTPKSRKRDRERRRYALQKAQVVSIA